MARVKESKDKETEQEELVAVVWRRWLVHVRPWCRPALRLLCAGFSHYARTRLAELTSAAQNKCDSTRRQPRYETGGLSLEG